MEFRDSIKEVVKLLNDYLSIDLTTDSYDALMVKELAQTNTIRGTEKGGNSVILLTGQQTDFFPQLLATEYYKNKNTDFKKFYIAKVKVWLNKQNIEKLGGDITKFDFDNPTYVHAKRNVKTEQADQCELGYKGGGPGLVNEADGKDYISFWELLQKNYYLVALKRHRKYEYEFYGVDAVYAKANGLGQLNNKASFEKKASTSIDADEYKSSLQIETNHPINMILFGAPGTGKSFKVEEYKNELLEGDSKNNYKRVTFYPDYTFAKFVGAYKPETDGDKHIVYEYVPGPFIELYVNACKNPSKKYLLIIEEINRADAASVFGDMFQLLDRDKNNCSEYPVSASKELKKYLEEHKGKDSAERDLKNTDELSLPANLYIWATMNSADQGVYPMDTAFKRRWSFKYIGINDSQDKIEEYSVKNGKSDDLINLNDFRIRINDLLTQNGINEDKLLGPFFIDLTKITVINKKDNELDKDEFDSIFCDKVLMYLYEDACKWKRDSIFSQPGIRYSELCTEFKENGKSIFKFTD